MEMRKIGSLEVSIVGLGTNNFGMAIDEAVSARVLHAALDAGANFVDTADIYGATESEEFIGRALKGRRDEVVLATKFGNPVNADYKGGAKPEYVRAAAEASLRRLQTDRIDLLILHRPDPQTPIADTLAALDGLVKSGKVIEIGCSELSIEQLVEAEEAVAPGAARFVNLQSLYSVLRRRVENEILPECVRADIAFVPYSPLANGLLTGKYKRDEPPPAGARLANVRSSVFSDKTFDTLEALTRFSESRGHTLLDLAVSWLLSQPAVVSVIAGATSPEQAIANIAAGQWQLSESDLAEVNEIAPRR